MCLPAAGVAAPGATTDIKAKGKMNGALRMAAIVSSAAGAASLRSA